MQSLERDKKILNDEKVSWITTTNHREQTIQDMIDEKKHTEEYDKSYIIRFLY